MFKDIQATIHIDLDKPLKELWKNLDKDARWGVKRAKNEKLAIKIIDRENPLWNEFYEIYKETIIQGGIPPEDLDKIREQTDKLFLCLKEEEILAGAAIKIKEDRTELFLNASQPGYLKYQPNNLLYWGIIVWSKNNNFKIFDLGGYQLKAKKGSKLWNINRFKERWGGEVVKYQLESNNPFYILGRKIIRNVHFIKNLSDKRKLKKWKKRSKLSD